MRTRVLGLRAPKTCPVRACQNVMVDDFPVYSGAGTMSDASKGCGCLLCVDDNNKLLGTLADADMRRALTKEGPEVLEKTVKELMNFSKSFPATTTEEVMAFDCMSEMEKPTKGGNAVSYMPVLSTDGTLRGLITTHELVQCGL
eukprot:scaffold1172_cov409-Prasinococcus_capsulatus_cf.AAC.8